MSTELARPIFTQEALEDYLRRMAPYVCHGRCVQVEAEAKRRQEEWEKLTPEQRQAQIKALQGQVDHLLELFTARKIS